MASVKCKKCKAKVPFSYWEDVVECPNCQTSAATGQKDILKKRFERNQNHLPQPQATVARALLYASAIYGEATHNVAVDPEDIERIVGNVAPGSAADTAKEKISFLRRLENAIDKRSSCVIYLVKNSSPAWEQILVVHRGSRGDEAGGSTNPKGAGWGDFSDGTGNIDWRANLSNDLVDARWGAGRVHKGFQELYESVATNIEGEVLRLMGKYPKASVVVTGHSLGAAQCVLSTMHLTSVGIKTFCFPFNTPMVGDANFVKEFDAKVSSSFGPIASEGPASYRRCFNFIRKSDSVSWGRYGFKNHTAEATEQRNRTADVHDTVTQVKDLMGGRVLEEDAYKRTKSKIFYQVPNCIYMQELTTLDFVTGKRRSHEYAHTQKELLGAKYYRK